MSWFNRDPERLDIEKQVAVAAYPEARFYKQGDLIRIRVVIRGRKNEYDIEIIYPSRFPAVHPDAFLRSPAEVDCPHILPDGQLSVHPAGGFGTEISGKVLIDWSVLWLQHFEYWLDTGNWPED